MNGPPKCYSEGYRDGERAAVEKYRALFTRIAELDGPIECTSLHEWRDKVRQMAANSLSAKK